MTTGDARPKSEKRRRTRLVGVRLTSAEHATVEHGARACGLSMPEFLRRVALSGGEELLRVAATDERGVPGSAHCPNDCRDGIVPCWNPGGPCPEGRVVCEMCGECNYCRNVADLGSRDRYAD